MTALALLLALAAADAPAADAPAADAPAADASALVAEAAEAALAEAWPDARGAARVSVVRLSGDAAHAAPPVRVRWLADAPPRGRVSAEVLAPDADGGWARAGWAVLDVSWTETAAVVARDVARGEAVTPADVRLEAVETTRLGEPLLDPDALAGGGWTAARALRAGTPLTARRLAPPAAAEARAPVRVTYARRGVRIEFDAEARERGAVGETIRAAAHGRTLRVRLTAPGRAEWVQTL